MDDDFINDFVKKQKAKAEAQTRDFGLGEHPILGGAPETEEQLRITQPLEEQKRLIEQKAPQVWADLREHIEAVILKIREASVKEGLKPTINFSSPRTDEVLINCGVQGVKANYNKANHRIEFATMIDTAQPWKELIAVVEGGDVKFGERIAGSKSNIMPLSFDEITRGLLKSFNE
jgi:hypothetical protein